MPSIPASTGIAPGRPSVPLDQASVREWLCAFADRSRDHAILLLDPDLTVLWANDTAGVILGAEPQSLVGESVRRFFTPRDQQLGIPDHEAAVARTTGASENDRWMQRVDGSRFWATGRTEAVLDVEGAMLGALKIFRDGTDLWMQISALHERADALHADGERRMRAMATLSHEMRNPLSVVSNYVALMERDASAASLAPQLRAIRGGLEAMQRMVEDLDDAVRSGTGKLALRPEPLTLQQVLDAAIDTALQRAGAPSRALERIYPAGPIALPGDAMRLQQVFANLIGNACKFTREGGRIWVGCSAEAEDAVVRIKDDGAGIAPEMLEIIFQMFTQVSAPGVSRQGLGIGLALVKEIVELHGGSVQASSRGPGLGAEFVVRLPLADATVGD
jgi:PAS domain S-box-containing protein